MEYLKRFKVEVVSITEKFEDTPEGHLLHAVQGFLGEVEAEKIRLRTLRGKQHRAAKALTGQGATPTYGYVWVDGEEYKKERYALNLTVIAVINVEEWTEVRVVEFCYDCCLQGMSCRQIALLLTRMGIPTQRGKETWNRRTVRQILCNRNYTGDSYNGRYTKTDGVILYPKQGTVKLPEGIYPQIITLDVYEQAQLQLDINAQMSARNNKHPQDTILRTMIFCGICGRRMSVKNFNTVRPGRLHPDAPVYRCQINDGIEGTLHHHHVSIPTHTVDDGSWEFVAPYMENIWKTVSLFAIMSWH